MEGPEVSVDGALGVHEVRVLASQARPPYLESRRLLTWGYLPLGKRQWRGWGVTALSAPSIRSEEPGGLGSRPFVPLCLALLLCKWACRTALLRPKSAGLAGFDVVFG